MPPFVSVWRPSALPHPALGTGAPFIAELSSEDDETLDSPDGEPPVSTLALVGLSLVVSEASEGVLVLVEDVELEPVVLLLVPLPDELLVLALVWVELLGVVEVALLEVDETLLVSELVLVDVTVPGVVAGGLDSLEHAASGETTKHKTADRSLKDWILLMGMAPSDREP